MTNNYQSVIIIGAGRSGTNMLRDVLTSYARVETWPCDEINYIWRHGNKYFTTDALSAEMATEKVKKYINNQFDRIAKNSNAEFLIEKTCANSLRVDFVNEVCPYAKFIHIIRDGRDVAVSASERWHANLDIPYLLAKAKYVPLSDLPYYAGRYALNRVSKLLNSEQRLSTWGPKFDGMDEIFNSNPSHIASGIQWQKCVESSMESFQHIEDERVYQLTYENFVASPFDKMKGICEFIGINVEEDIIRKSVERVSIKSVGRWKEKLSDDEISDLEAEIGNLLTKLNYLPAKLNKFKAL